MTTKTENSKSVSNTGSFIEIKGARVNNLKNISIKIPRNELVVFTGLSGSGKSSLAFDTLYAEGQRRYIESLSSYARQFLGKMQKPDVDDISGISPAIAVEQKTNNSNPRSTVGTSTEIYEYLKLLYSKIGKTYSPVSGKEVTRHTTKDVVQLISEQADNTTIYIFCPIIIATSRDFKDQLQILLQQGYTRLVNGNDIVRINDLIKEKKSDKKDYQLLIDRFVYENDNEDLEKRIIDSIETAFTEGNGTCFVRVFEDENNYIDHAFSNKFEADGITFIEPTPHFFSFNNPYGACQTCNGFGNTIGIDEDLVIPNKSLSIAEEAIMCWRGEKMSEFKNLLMINAHKFNFPVHKPISELSDEQYELLWNGNEHFCGLNEFFEHLKEQTYKIQYRVMLARYRGKTICPDCKGTRLRKDANYVKINDKSITQLVLMPIDELLEFFKNIKLTKHEQEVSGLILKEIINRLSVLCDVGLSYLNLNRLTSTLSGGETQRINIATSLGSWLIGSMYILDEPSVGLHPRDTKQLIGVLKNLRDIGNTVIVVEHDEDIIRQADYIVDIGPKAGVNGGNIVFSGVYEDLLKNKESITAKFFNKELDISVPTSRRKWKNHITINGARENNLKNIDVKIPLSIITTITGVSGSGKTTLVKNILYPALKRELGGSGEKSGKHDKISGDINKISHVEIVDQNLLGRSSRSNPATFVKAFDDIRQLFSKQKLAEINGFKPGHFSFNIKGGRCEECEGNGYITIGMQFMADVKLVCDECKGKKYKQETLEVKFNDLNIADVLELSISEAIAFFNNSKTFVDICQRIVKKLNPLEEIGLGYLKLGQSSDTFSGGEAQRLKLASYLTDSNIENTLFIFDEPTTGLHRYDIEILLKSFEALIRKGHTILIIEHNTDIIKSSDWIIDLGPEGGKNGGYVVFEGTPEDIINCENSYTGKFLKEKM